MDKLRVQIEGDDYWLEGGDFEDMLAVVRRIAGRRFDSDEKVWLLPGHPTEVAQGVVPFRLMYEDDDPIADSTPIQVGP